MAAAIFLVSGGTILGCASAGSLTAHDAPRVVSDLSGTIPAADSKALTQEILSADAEIEPAPHSEVPLEINVSVQKWIDYFSSRDRKRFLRFLERGLRYKELVQSILKENSVPREMYYLAMIESGYVLYARSPARAVGAWQFMPATGRRYGLKSNFYLDERKDIVRSTRAAARYLKDLHDEFDSWYLALAAYNAGEGRIRRAIRKGKSRDFWILVKRRALPRETVNYVPKFLAAVVVGRNLPKYGFENVPEKRLPSLKSVAVPASVHLKEVAKSADIPLTDLKEYNPHLIRDVTPGGLKDYEIWVPEGRANRVAEVAESLPRYAGSSRTLKRRTYAALPEEGRRVARFHRVRRGETLISIARRYRLTVPALKKLNQLRSSRIIRGQRLQVKT